MSPPPASLTFVQRLIGLIPFLEEWVGECVFWEGEEAGRLALKRRALMKARGLAGAFEGRKEQISLLFLDKADRWAGRLQLFCSAWLCQKVCAHQQ